MRDYLLDIIRTPRFVHYKIQHTSSVVDRHNHFGFCVDISREYESDNTSLHRTAFLEKIVRLYNYDDLLYLVNLCGYCDLKFSTQNVSWLIHYSLNLKGDARDRAYDLHSILGGHDHPFELPF